MIVAQSHNVAHGSVPDSKSNQQHEHISNSAKSLGPLGRLVESFWPGGRHVSEPGLTKEEIRDKHHEVTLKDARSGHNSSSKNITKVLKNVEVDIEKHRLSKAGQTVIPTSNASHHQERHRNIVVTPTPTKPLDGTMPTMHPTSRDDKIGK